MIGLMKKDFMMIRRQIFIIIALMAFYFIIMGFGKSQDYQIGMFGGYMIALIAILPITMLAYDEKNKWGRYEAALPVTRKQSVISKYLLMFLFALSAIAVFSVFCVIKNIHYPIEALAGIFSAAIIISSVILTVSYRFGTDKARFIFIGICFAAALIILNVFSESEQMRNSFEGSLNSLISGNITVIMLVFAMLIYFTSMTVSIFVYLRKDL